LALKAPNIRIPISHSPDLIQSHKPSRRTSFYEREMKFVPPPINSTPQILYQHIDSDLQLERLNIPSVLSFIEDYKKLQQKQRTIPLQLGDFLAPSVIRQLVSDALEYDGTDFNNRIVGNTLLLDNQSVYDMILRYIRPTSKEILLKCLNKNLKFPPLPNGYVVTTTYYQPMWRALLEYRNKFISLYEVLTADIEFELPPLRTHNTVKGLIAAFLDHIPQEHGAKVFKRMNYEQVKAMKCIVTDFIPVFFTLARGLFDQSMKVRDTNDAYDMNFTAQVPSKPAKTLHALGAATDYSPFPAEQDAVSVMDEDELQPGSLSALNIATKPDKTLSKAKPLPCFSMVRTGKCLRGPKCTFSHKEEDLYAAWTASFQELQASPFNARNRVNPDKTGKPISGPKLHHLSDTGDPLEDSEDASRGLTAPGDY
jgi:hypothetical protein